MKRREFGKTIAAGSMGAAAGSLPGGQSAGAQTGRRATVRMHVGCQSGGTSIENLQFKKRHGVDAIDGGSPTYTPGSGWDLDEVLEMKERCESEGVALEAFHTPLSSAGIDRVGMPGIMLGKSPERDREIEDFQQIIEVASKAGIRLLNYNLTILPVLRTESTPGRGGCRYSTWKLSEAPDGPLTTAGEVPEGEMWERMAYFVERVVPVAEEYRVQLGNHLPDPPTPPGYRGIHRVLGKPNAEGLRQFLAIKDSPYHGFNFCIGSFAEGLEDPNREVHDFVREFGARKKIFNVHFRNIIGSRNDFMEVYPDNGDIDMYQLVRVFKEVDYPYMLMPDHVPRHDDDPGGRQAFAFAYGYIKALIQAVSAEA